MSSSMGDNIAAWATTSPSMSWATTPRTSATASASRSSGPPLTSPPACSNNPTQPRTVRLTGSRW